MSGRIEAKDPGQNGARRTNGNKEYIYIKAHAALTAATPYRIGLTDDADGLFAQTLAIVDDTSTYYVCVPETAIASGAQGWVQVRGQCTLTVASATYTAGRALKILDGVVTEIADTDKALNTEFGIIDVGGTTVTSITAVLKGREVLATT